MCCLTFELRRDRQRNARPARWKMRQPTLRAWYFDVGPRLERGVRRHWRRYAMSSLIWVLAAAIAATVAMIAAHRAHKASCRADDACASAAVALARAAARSSEAIRLASLAIDRASEAIESVRSSRASRLAADSASLFCCSSSSHSLAEAPTSSPLQANSVRVCGSPILSNTAKYGEGGFFDVIEGDSSGAVGGELRGVGVTPNVRVKPAPTAWRAGQQAQNGPQAQRLMAGVTRCWGSA